MCPFLQESHGGREYHVLGMVSVPLARDFYGVVNRMRLNGLPFDLLFLISSIGRAFFDVLVSMRRCTMPCHHGHGSMCLRSS